MLNVAVTDGSCGAVVTGVDLSTQLSHALISEIRGAWLEHLVLVFPDQHLTDPDLVRFAECFGGVGDDPYFESIAADNPVVALTRRADERAPVFAESWHSDWSFKACPPIGTALYSLVIPPVGGNTDFINQQRALAEMPDELRRRLEGRVALHSAAAAYAPEGAYGIREQGSDRSMKILYSEDARDVNAHPFIRRHPESGRETLFGCMGYIVGVEGMAEDEARALIGELYAWQTREAFRYSHRWAPGMLVLWDNRSVLHRANGGYDGYARELHRITIRDDAGRYLRLAAG
ncbi:MAG: TauD/TfdA family dioxygenase [Pseudomonadales bacterium]|jgi:taurine dioxygenase